jgi:hypothetical protein
MMSDEIPDGFSMPGEGSPQPKLLTSGTRLAVSRIRPRSRWSSLTRPCGDLRVLLVDEDGAHLAQDRRGDHGLGLGRLEPVVLPCGQVPVPGGVRAVVLQTSPCRSPGCGAQRRAAGFA